MAIYRVIRAVRRADGSCRIAVEPAADGIDAIRAYTAAEVEQLAASLGAELRWVAPLEGTRSADPFGGPLPPGDEGWDDEGWAPDADAPARSADLFGGTLPPGDGD